MRTLGFRHGPAIGAGLGHGCRRAVLCLVLCVPGLQACNDSGPAPVPTNASLASLLESGALLSIGTEDDSLTAFERIRDARISPDGETIVVVDANPPFLRVFGRDGALRGAGVARGEGPGESRTVHALALRDDRALVLDQGFKLVDLDGTVVAEQPAGVSGIMPLTALRACGDGWIVYGPARAAPAAGSGRTWISNVRVNANGEWKVEALLSDPGGTSAGSGARQFAARSGDELLILHRYGDPPRMLRARCAAESTWTPAEDLGFLIRPGVTELSTDHPNPNGFVFVADGLLWSEWVWRLPPGTTDAEQIYTETIFTLVTADSVFGATVAGDYRLLDARPGRDVLLEVTEPYPRVLLVDARSLAAAVRAGRTGSR